MKNKARISLAVLSVMIVMSIVGCSEEFSLEKDNIYLDIKLGSRADENADPSKIIGNRTYRVILFHPDSGEKLAEGTYYDEDGTGSSSGFLSPWATDEEGNKIGNSLDKTKGLYVERRRVWDNKPYTFLPISYSMVIISPAREIENLSIGDVIRYGFKYPRVSTVAENQRQYVSDMIPVEITARGEVKSSENGETTYHDCIDLEGREDAILKERRSKIHFEIYGSDKVNFTLSKVQFLTQKEAYYAPFKMEYISEEELNDDVLLLFNGSKKYDGVSAPLVLPQSKTDMEKDGITYSEASDDIDGVNKDFLYLLSQDYSKTGDDGELKYLTSELVLSLERTGETDEMQTADVRIPLSLNAESHHRYFFKIVVESVYVKLKIYVDKWDDMPHLDGTITAPIEWKASNAVVDSWKSDGEIPGSISNN